MLFPGYDGLLIREVAAALQSQVPTITGITEVTEANDANNLIGGTVLLRVSGILMPSQAAVYEEAFSK